MRILLVIFSCLLLITLPSNAQEADETKESQDTQQTTDPASAAEKTDSSQSHSVDRAKINIAPPISKSAQQLADIKRYLTEQNIEPIAVGEDSVLVQIQPEQSPIAKGVAILIPDWNHSLSSPKSITSLRERLPESGWVTMAAQPPQMDENIDQLIKAYYQDKLKANDSSMQTANESTAQESNTSEDDTAPEPLARYKEKLTALMKVLMEKAYNYPGIFIVIAEGTNAALLTELYHENAIERPSAFILLSAYYADDNANTAFNKLLATSPYPVLDLLLTRDNPWVMHSKEERKQLAKKHAKVIYRQQQLTTSHTGYYPDEALHRSIKGWLRSIGW